MITVMAPDLPSMSGGLRVMYDLVAALERSGRPARIWHGEPGFSIRGLEGVAPVVGAAELELDAGDLLLMPEVGGSKWSTLNPEVPTVMLVQAIDFVVSDADFLVPLPDVYPGWPQVSAAIAVSDVVEEYLRAMSPDLPVHRVPISIDPTRFAPAEKERLISFMPRRRSLDLLGSVQLLHRRGLLREWRLAPIENLTHAEVAEVMARSAVFLAGGEREGFGLPAAEAMAAGALVVGWTGHGGREFMRPGLATVVDDSDVVSMARGVQDAMELFDHDRASFEARTEAGRGLIAERYAPVRHDEAVVRAVDALTGSGSPSVLRHPSRVAHFRTHAPPTGSLGRAYVGARTVAGRLRRRLQHS